VEHEVKALLVERGVATPAGYLIGADRETPVGTPDPDGGPWFVKAQVAAGDRAAAGGVLRAATLGEARAAARAMLGLTVAGVVVDQVLVERAVAVSGEGYAAVTVAEDPPRRVVTYAPSGGAGFDPDTAPVRLDVTDGPQGYRIRRALQRAGVASADLLPLTAYLETLVACARTWCAYTLETNPITLVDGKVVALDAKADLDDYSRDLLPRPELLDRPDQDERERAARERQRTDHRGSLRYVQLVPEQTGRGEGPQVASHSVGGGESMVVLDALAAAGLTATNYCDTSGSPSEDKVALGAALVAGQKHVDGLFFSTCIANQPLSVTARGLVRGWNDVAWRGPTVARFAGNQSAEARDILAAWAAEHDVPIVLLSETEDEWQAADALADLLATEVTR
jgi:succinyl-CoA synthetase beta subunit